MKETSEEGDAGDGFAPTGGVNDAVVVSSRALPTDGSAPRTGAGRWVESSWDLRRGLTVQEGLPADAGLDEWIEALIRGPGH